MGSRVGSDGARRPPAWHLAGKGSRVLGVFAHPDDEVFCVGGAMAASVSAGAVGGIVSLTRGEAGQIRDASTATRRTLGEVRARELVGSASAIGVDTVECLDLGDGSLADRFDDPLVDLVAEQIDRFAPDVVVTFGLDGGYGHPDHIVSAAAAAAAIERSGAQVDLRQAAFPMTDQLLLDVIVRWLRGQDDRFVGTAAFGHALKLFADGSSMLGFAADHIDVEWYPTGSFIIEQGEPASELYCVLSGRADVLIEHPDGSMEHRDVVGPGSFVGEDGIATGRPRNAHVVASSDVTCLVLSPTRPSASAGRGGLGLAPGPGADDGHDGARELPADAISIDVSDVLESKVGALAAHRSQYAFSLELFPRSMLESILGTEHYVPADAAEIAEAGRRWRHARTTSAVGSHGAVGSDR